MTQALEEKRRFRRSVLASFGAKNDEFKELLSYNDNIFEHPDDSATPDFPLPDEPFVAAWERYVETAESRGAVSALRQALVQLNFPIRRGISEGAAYRSVLRRGEPVDRCVLATGLALVHPERIRLSLEATPAGRIGVIFVGHREDFENIIRAVTMRNEPDTVPPSMGAMMVAGFNNWDRIQAYRRAWAHRQGCKVDAETWDAEFRRLIPQRPLYQDRFIILSKGPYSGVDASKVGLSSKQWTEVSGAIRLHHECTHYFTRRVLGAMRNNLIDEVIADYMGMIGSVGRFRADWFERFMGLGLDECASGKGRLGIYRGDPPLCDGAFDVLRVLVRRAAQNLERFDAQWGGHWRTVGRRGQLIMALTRMTLEELASSEADGRLLAHLGPTPL